MVAVIGERIAASTACRCDHAFVEVLIRGIADEKRNALG
jgi:hypothetical protein